MKVLINLALDLAFGDLLALDSHPYLAYVQPPNLGPEIPRFLENAVGLYSYGPV